MFELSRPKIRIADLAHRVALCTMHDVVEDGGTMVLARTPVLWIWAQIDCSLNAPSFTSPEGYAFRGSQYQGGTHRVIIRAASGIEPSSAAWVYERRRKSAHRWYKVTGWTESDQWLILNSQLRERSDNAQPPVGTQQLQPQPSNVEL